MNTLWMFRPSRLKMGFFKKISIHITLLILLTGSLLSTVTAYRFRQEIYRLEFSSAFTVYTAAINYLTAHYRTHRSYITRSMDYVLGEKFLRVEGVTEHEISHRPDHVILLDEMGHIIYEFWDEKLRPDYKEGLPSLVMTDEVPEEYRQWYDAEAGVIRVAGPVSPSGDAPGYVLISLPTSIKAQMRMLWLQTAGLMLITVTLAILISLPFTRDLLSPIVALTRAAHRVHQGDWEQKVQVYSDDEIGELAQTFNDMVASVSRRLQFMHQMQEWTVKIGGQLDRAKILAMLGDMFERMSSAQAFRLYVYDAKTEELTVRLERNGELLPQPADDQLSIMALKERWMFCLKPDGEMDSEPENVVEAAIPLLSGKHRIGVVRIAKSSDKEFYDDETLTILQTLAQQAAVAIDNANLYQQLALQERIEQEMALARDIQQSMLPREAPHVPGYEICGGGTPALEVGGDYFDYVSHNGHWYMIIGDVSGKGVPAALIMSIVRALMHTYLEFETSPRTVLSRVNRNISEGLDPEMFVTLSTLQLDPVNHTLCIARAGHEPVMIVHANGTVDSIAPKGTALGMLDVESFDEMIEETTCDIRQDDTILLYTDGITEAQNKSMEEFGYQRLEALVKQHTALSPQDLHKVILDEVKAFADGMAQSDDITLIILRRNGLAVAGRNGAAGLRITKS